MNPVHYHCGPGNSIKEFKSENDVDEACRQHDIQYGKYQKVAGYFTPYFKSNDGDMQFIHDLESNTGGRFIDRIGKRYYSDLFKIKRVLAPRISPELEKLVREDQGTEPIIEKSSRVVEKKVKKVTKVRMPYRRQGIKRRRRRRFMRRKRRGKSRIGRSFRSQLAMRPMKKQTILESRWCANAAPSALLDVFVACSLRTKYQYDNLILATDNEADAFGSTARTANYQYSMYAYCQTVAHNYAQGTVYVTPYWVSMKKDYFDSDLYAPAGATTLAKERFVAEDNLIEILYQGLRAQFNTTDDTSFVRIDPDYTDERSGARLCMPPVQLTSPLLKYFAKVTKGRQVKIEPGQQVSFVTRSKKIKRILPHQHADTAGNHQPHLIGGHTKFLLLQVKSQIPGTAEADLGADEHEKVGYQGTFNVILNNTYQLGYKSLSLETHGRDLVNYIPTISQADERMIIDTGEDHKDPEYN